MSEPEETINVVSCHNSRRLWSRQSMLVWVNNILKSNIIKVDHLCTGAAYCCLMDILFPDSVNLRRVKFVTNRAMDFTFNFQMLQQSFRKNCVDKIIPVDKLIRGKFQDNYDFAIWFRLFFMANFRKMPKGYDVEKKRFNQCFRIANAEKLKRSSSSTTLKYRPEPRPRSATQDPVPRRRYGRD